MQHRVVITGMGAVTPLGIGIDAFWEGLRAGRSGAGYITRFDASEHDTRFAAEVKDFDPTNWLDRREARRADRYTQYAIAAGDMALQDAGLEPQSLEADRSGVYFGSGIGGMETFSEQFRVMFEKGPGRVSPLLIPMMIVNMAGGQLAIRYNMRGPNMTTVTACSSSNNAIGEAFFVLRYGRADVMLAGGSEAAIVPLTVAGFNNMHALSKRNEEPEKASRPFDAQRDGFVLGEGAACLVMETLEHAERRGARILAEIIGYGCTADAFHQVQPPPDGAGAARSMQRAREDAGIRPEDVDYINAHGTSTPQGDVAETNAVKSVFGEHARKLMISSTKSMHGHTLGAAGAVETVATVLTIRHGMVPPTINYEYPDPECDLDYVPNAARQARVRVALNNSFGFGGQNSTLVLRRFDG